MGGGGGGGGVVGWEGHRGVECTWGFFYTNFHQYYVCAKVTYKYVSLVAM